MILLALLLGALGIADLVRARSSSLPRLWLAAFLGIAAFLLASIGSGQHWWWSPVAAAAVIGWLASTRESDGSHRAGYWAVGGIAAVVVVAFVWGPLLPPVSGPIVDWYRELPYTALSVVPFTSFALTIGGALFLVETANVIVRLALRGEKTRTAEVLAAESSTPPVRMTTRRSWWRSSSAAAEPPTPAPVAPFTELKGGRFIGPLERLFLLALVLAGAFTAVAAIVAAKGIIRFPEISKDAVGGSKAEYFLVGSFASWALVLLVVLQIVTGSTRL
ncbi:hypothetical protein ABIE21_001491 [Conyzicola nivalis]|uniref:Uncharacterized protein n=1 Tax=Conyzicola nivalis TaxID=1477021 RepID=A0ABV2QLU5_9MICO